MNLDQYLSDKNAADLARALGISPVLVSQWRKATRPVPIERCTQIETATGGQVSRKDLRPHDWMRIWPELADAEGNKNSAECVCMHSR